MFTRDIAAIEVITRSQQSSKDEKRKYSVGVTLLFGRKSSRHIYAFPV